MTISRRIAAALTLSAAMASPVIADAQTRPGAATAAPSPAGAGIIPLPLNPIVPAAQRTCTAKTPTGLGYSVLRPGTGAKPTAEDTVLVNYIGYLATTGAAFDQSMQTPMPVGAVIPGFSQGLQLIGRGGVIRLCIPAALGYGARATGQIPANADLVFQVEMLDFKTAAEIAEMRKAAEAAPTTPPQP